MDKVYEMYLQANQKLRQLRIKQSSLLSIATTLNKKLKTDYLLDETIACIPVFNKIETSLMNLEATILEIKLKFSTTSETSESKQVIDVKVERNIQVEKKVQKPTVEKPSKKVIQAEQKTETDVEILAKKEDEIQIKTTSDKKIHDVTEKLEKEGSKSKKVKEDDIKTEIMINKTDNKVEITANTNKKQKPMEKSEIIAEKSKEKLLEGIAAEGSKVQVPKIKIIKDAAKVWEGKEALKKAFKAWDSLYEVFNTRKIFFLIKRRGVLESTLPAFYQLIPSERCPSRRSKNIE